MGTVDYSSTGEHYLNVIISMLLSDEIYSTLEDLIELAQRNNR